MRRTIWTTLAITLSLMIVGPGRAQFDGADGDSAGVTADLLTDVASIAPGKPFRVAARLKIQKGFHGFYRTSGDTGLPTSVSFKAPEGFKVGPVRFPRPDVEELPGATGGGRAFIYHETTLMVAEVTPPEGFSGQAEIKATIDFQFCKDGGSCFAPQKVNPALTLKAGDGAPSPDRSQFEESVDRLPVSAAEAGITVTAEWAGGKLPAPGESGSIRVIVTPAAGTLVGGTKPGVSSVHPLTLIVHHGSKQLVKSIDTLAGPPGSALGLGGELARLNGYREAVTFDVDVTASKRAPAPGAKVSGALILQTVKDGKLGPVQLVEFDVGGNAGAAATAPAATSVAVNGSNAPAGPKPSSPEVSATKAPTEKEEDDPAALSADTSRLIRETADKVVWINHGEASPSSLGTYLVYAFLGGLILNVMPCVLPVLAIKMLGFVQQSGESRGRILLLNLAHAAGTLTVFLFLAVLAVGANQSWGGLFQHTGFNVVMAALVFAMALSLLGLWEIPIPGFIGHAGSQHQEGPFGVFLMGIFATLLATPCSGPFLGVTLGWSVQQPPPITFLIWGVMGLGMSSPFLIVGLFPSLIHWLPRPGLWMERFKEFCGLVLMGAVVFIFSFIKPEWQLGSLVVLLGTGVGCWIVGRFHTALDTQLRSVAVHAIAVVALLASVAVAVRSIVPGEQSRLEREAVASAEKFLSAQAIAKSSQARGASPGKNTAHLPWEPFSTARLRDAMSAGRPVVIDFSAKWCLTCKTNEAVAINIPSSKERFESLNAVALYADFSDGDPEVRAWLDHFKSIGVPLTVVIPGGVSQDRPARVLRDLFGAKTFQDALGTAGSSGPLASAGNP